MDSLNDLFDGWTHYLVPNEDFTADEPRVFVSSWDEEDEELGSYESPSPNPVWENGKVTDVLAPFIQEQMSWGGVVLALKSLTTIIGGTCIAYQHNTYDKANKLEEPTFSYQFMPGDSGYQEGRL